MRTIEEEFLAAVEEAGGSREDARRALRSPVIRRNIALLVMGRGKMVAFPSEVGVPHLIPWDYKIRDDVEPTLSDPATFRFHPILRPGEKELSWKQVERRARDLLAWKGLSDVPALLGPDEKGLRTIPVELRKKNSVIILPATTLEGYPLSYHVPMLFWGIAGDEWELHMVLTPFIKKGDNAYFVSCDG